jgi:hypothetical protein
MLLRRDIDGRRAHLHDLNDHGLSLRLLEHAPLIGDAHVPKQKRVHGERARERDKVAPGRRAGVRGGPHGIEDIHPRHESQGLCALVAESFGALLGLDHFERDALAEQARGRQRERQVLVW